MRDSSFTRQRIVAFMADYERQHGYPPVVAEIEAVVGCNIWRELKLLTIAGRVHTLTDSKRSRKYSALIA